MELFFQFLFFFVSVGKYSVFNAVIIVFRFGASPRIGLQPASEYTLVILVIPVGDYYKGGLSAVPAVVRPPSTYFPFFSFPSFFVLL